MGDFSHELKTHPSSHKSDRERLICLYIFFWRFPDTIELQFTFQSGWATRNNNIRGKLVLFSLISTFYNKSVAHFHSDNRISALVIYNNKKYIFIRFNDGQQLYVPVEIAPLRIIGSKRLQNKQIHCIQY